MNGRVPLVEPQHWTLVLLLCVLACWTPRLARAQPVLSWTLPDSVTVMPWPGDPSTARVLPAPGAVWLAIGEVLLIPAEPGDVVRVLPANGERARLGVATGQAALPDVISWDAGTGLERRLPSWSSARFVAARVNQPGLVSVHVAARDEAARDWFNWDRRVASWLRQGGPAPIFPEGSTGARLVRWLDALLHGVPASDRDAVQDLLQACWLEQSLRWRPLVAPYFTRDPELSFQEPRTFGRGTRIELDASGADVIRWEFSSAGPARVIVREGGAIAHVSTWPTPPSSTLAAPRPRSVRAIVPAHTGRVSFEVQEGTVSVQQSAWIERPELAETFGPPRRVRHRLLERARHSRLPWAGIVAEARATRSVPPRILVAHADGLGSSDLRAWLLLEAARSESTSPAAAALAARSASAAHTLPVQIAALEQLWEMQPKACGDAVSLPERPDGSVPGNPFGEAAATDDELLGTALRERDHAPDGLRPAWGAKLEHWAAQRRSDRDVWTAVGGYWRSFPYRMILPVTGGGVSTEYVPLEPDLACASAPAALAEAADDHIDRWLLPEPGSIRLKVALPAQRFSKLLIKPLGSTPASETNVAVDGLPVPLHAGAGTSSEVALADGVHRLDVPPAVPAFAVRLGEGIEAPGAALRRGLIWTELAARTSLEFELPNPGATSVARVTLAPPGGEVPNAAPRQLEIRLGSERHEIWARDALSGPVELEVAPDVTTLLLASNSSWRVRVELRRAADESNAARSPNQDLHGNADLEQALQSLRELGRQLRTARTPRVASDLRRRRARLLEALGFKGLARRDADPEPESGRDWLWLPTASTPVVNVNIASQIVPLPLPADPRTLLERRRQLFQLGCQEASAWPARESIADAEALLIAHCAEQSGALARAARAYAAIGHRAANGAALLRAATLVADQSQREHAASLALEARLLAAEAGALGADTSDVLARLQPAIGWVVPSAYDRARGFATLELSTPDSPSLGERVRRALVDAPDDALLVGGDRVLDLEARVTGAQSLELDVACEDPTKPECQADVRRDAVPFACATSTPGTQHCAIPLAAGDKHQVDVKLPGDSALGWARATLGGRPLSGRLASRWIEIDPKEPAQLTVLGPTVVVIEARGAALDGQTLVWSACGPAADEHVLALPATRDENAVRTRKDGHALGASERVELPVFAPGPCRLSLRSTKDLVLVRASVAHALGGVPRARVEAPELSERISLPAPASPGTSPAVADTLDPDAGAAPRWSGDGLPLLLGGRIKAVSATLSLEEDREVRTALASSAHVESTALVERNLIPSRLWTMAEAGARWRIGAPTLLGRWLFDAPPSGAIPGAELEGIWYGESYDGGFSGSLRATATVSERVALTPGLALVPALAYTLDSEPVAPIDVRSVDVDVYSAYRADHPRYLNASLSAVWRPWVDATGKFELSSRALPDFDGIDRVTATGSCSVLPIPELDLLLDLSESTSYRPAEPLRERAFMRQTFAFAGSFWRWLSSSERLRFFTRLDAGFDNYGGKRSGSVFSAELGVELLTAGQRGLRDVPPPLLPFREFQERRKTGELVVNQAPEAEP